MVQEEEGQQHLASTHATCFGTIDNAPMPAQVPGSSGCQITLYACCSAGLQKRNVALQPGGNVATCYHGSYQCATFAVLNRA